MDTISIERGQTLALRFTFLQGDVSKTPIDLTGSVVTFYEASDPSLSSPNLTVVDPVSGVVEGTFPEGVTSVLSSGRQNWFRLEAQFPTTNIVSPKIWIKVHD